METSHPIVPQSLTATLLETKYRDIADGNVDVGDTVVEVCATVRNQVPRYSGWKHKAV